MNKHLLIIGVVAASCCGSAFAQSKINGVGRLLLDAYKSEARAKSASEETVIAQVKLASGVTAEALSSAGYEVTSAVADMAMVRVAMSKIEELAAMPEVKAVNFGTRAHAYLDKAREVSNVDEIHAGTGDGLSGISYTGKGVTVGLYDTGLDPNHAAFRDASGKSRVKAIYVRRSSSASNQEFTDEKSISEFTTEDPAETHGTHVLGIIAGTRGIQGEYGTSSTASTTGEIPYYGPAYESDIIVGCGDFATETILDGVAAVVNKATEIGQPAVVNLSLGSNFGSHDPNSSTGQWLDALGDDAIICISAGNEGDLPMALSKRFTSLAAGRNLNTFIVPQTTSTTGPTSPISYSAEFWCDTDEAFTCSLIVYDKSTSQIIESIPVKSDGSVARLASSSSSYMAEYYSSSSSIVATGSVDENYTNRYNVQIIGNVTATRTPTYCLGVSIQASSGRTVKGYVNSYSSSLAEPIFSSENVSGFTDGTNDGTINGFGCGHKMISVGAYVSRTSAPYVGTGSYSGSGTVGAIASFSSYGETSDGRRLPHVCAPGAQVVSSVSTYWTRNLDSFSADRTNARVTMDGRDNYWYPMQGTSMSSPFVAGVVALWLQAWPDMTVQQALDIITDSSIKDSYTNASANNNQRRWGAGKLDALAGLKLAIERNASLGNVLADNGEQNLIVENLGGRSYSVSYVNADKVSVEVYNMQGSKVLAADADSDSVELDASSLSDGIYVVNVVTPNGRASRKLALK